MPKQRSANSTRRPPMPAAGHEVIDAWFDDVMPAIAPVVRAADGLICASIPGLEYAIKWSKAYYGLPELGWLIELAAFHRSANIVFHAGARFDPPPPLGDGPRERYVKLHTVDDLDTPEVRSWILQAAQHPGWR